MIPYFQFGRIYEEEVQCYISEKRKIQEINSIFLIINDFLKNSLAAYRLR